MKRKSLGFFPLLLLLFVTVGSQPLNSDSSALEQLKTCLTSLQQVLNDPKLADAEHSFQRRKLARVILLQLFDFQEMSRQYVKSGFMANYDSENIA
jgi:hypothetical protein